MKVYSGFGPLDYVIHVFAEMEEWIKGDSQEFRVPIKR